MDRLIYSLRESHKADVKISRQVLYGQLLQALAVAVTFGIWQASWNAFSFALSLGSMVISLVRWRFEH
jgi:hypothetical protein